MRNIINNLDWSVLTDILVSVIPALLCITVHELSHGYTAFRLGDTTAKDMGRLTLNPIKHIDVFGVLMMVIAGFGWAKPVPVNMNRFKRPRRDMAITALAGPVSNIVMAAVIIIIFGFLYTLLGGDRGLGAEGMLYSLLGFDVVPGTGGYVLRIVSRMAQLSVALAVFNLVPVPPLDGSKILFSFFPENVYRKLMRYERFGMIILIVFVWSDFFDNTVGRLTVTFFYRICGLAVSIYNLLI